MVRVEVSYSFPASVSQAFAYITDMKNWPEYWPDFVRSRTLLKLHGATQVTK
jgi:hypothetical protein